MNSQFHISAVQYVQPGRCFVEWWPRENGGLPDWKVMTLATAKRDGRNIITCSRCDRPAVGIDPHWPWMSDLNHCEKHKP